MVQGKMAGRMDKPLLKGNLLNPPPFPNVYHWSDEPHVTEPQSTPLEWFTLTGQLESSAKPAVRVPAKDFETLKSLARRNLTVSSFQEWFTAYLGHCLQQPEVDVPHVIKVVRSLGLTISQLAKDSAFAVANFTLLRRDALIADLPHNVKEEDRQKLRTSSFRGRDLFVPDVVEATDLVLKGFNA